MAAHKDGREDEDRSASTAYETRDIKIRPLAVFTAGLAVLIIFSFLVVLGVFRVLRMQQDSLDRRSAASPAAHPSATASADEQLKWPEPRVQSHPADDLKALRDEEDGALTTYGWVDRANGVVRVPIDVAMQLVLKDGLPARQPGTGSPVAGSPARVIAPGSAEQSRKVP